MFFAANREVCLGAHGNVLPVHSSDAPWREANERTSEGESDGGVPNGKLTRVTVGRIHEPLDARIQGAEACCWNWWRNEPEQCSAKDVLISNMRISFNFRCSDVRLLQPAAQRSEGNPQERQAQEEASEWLALLHVVRFVLQHCLQLRSG
jgi:hypothetical protein